ncbi:MAG: hypothetical protein IKV76_08660 [Clostridia bacterium]|nr:hypothetical protein [Clostridia bacterium]
MIKKKLIAAILLILSSLVIIFFNFSEEKGIIKALVSSLSFSESFENNNPLSTKHFEMLNIIEKKAYINVFNKIKNHPEYIRIPELTNKEFNNVFFAVKNDNPDILCFSDSCNMITFLGSTFLQMDYSYDISECDTMMTELASITDTIVSDIPSGDEVDKELYIHDYIVKNCEYSESPNSSNAYGCLIEKKAVCSGYSRAAMILLKKAGIESTVISGTGITAENEKISHMWNIVWLNNEPYHLDVTWDDPVSQSEGFISHLFFNLTDKNISTDHIDHSFNVQATDSTYNYFVINELLFYKFDKITAGVIADKICDNINNGKNYLEFKFSDNKSYSAAVNGIINSDSLADELYIIINQLSENVSDMIDISHVSFSKDDKRHYIRIMFDKI